MSAVNLAWLISASREEAESLEATLLAAWRPPINVA